MNVDFAYIIRTHVAVGLKREGIGRARIVRLLVSQASGGNDGVLRTAQTCRSQHEKQCTPIFETHLPSGAELPKAISFLRVWLQEGGRKPVDSPETSRELSGTWAAYAEALTVNRSP